MLHPPKMHASNAIVKCCKPCKESHKQCDGARPCGRYAATNKLCEDPVVLKRGRPRKQGKDAVAMTPAQAPASSREDRMLLLWVVDAS